jgi:hypothetical protein
MVKINFLFDIADPVGALNSGKTNWSRGLHEVDEKLASSLLDLLGSEIVEIVISSSPKEEVKENSNQKKDEV